MTQNPDVALSIVKKLCDAAIEGSVPAAQLIFDRIDGKLGISLDDGTGVPLQVSAIVIRGVEPTREAIEGEMVVPATLPSPDT